MTNLLSLLFRTRMERMKKNTTMRRMTTGCAMALISLSVDARAGRQSLANIQVSKDGHPLTPTKTSTSVRCVSVGACTAKVAVFLQASLMNLRKYLSLTIWTTTESPTLQNAAYDD